MKTRRVGEPRIKRVGYSKPPKPLNLETWRNRWCPDLPDLALKQLEEIKSLEER